MVILLVDDDASLLNALSEYFKSDYDVYTASNGQQGLALFNKLLPAAVIVDLCMPDMGGISVLEKIKETDPNVPVIMMSAYGEIDEAVRAIQFGSEHFLTKPVDLHSLDALIRKSVNIARIKKNTQCLQEKGVKKSASALEQL